jgi:Icc-related predicted phosphoesterase
MRIAAIGDPHGDLDKIERIPLDQIDLVLMTGDLGRADILRKMALRFLAEAEKGALRGSPQAEEFRQAFLSSYNTAVKLVEHIAGLCPVFTVTGNADITNSDTRKFSRQFGIELPLLYDRLMATGNVRIIDNRLAVFRGVRIGGIRYFTDISWAEEFELAGIEKVRQRTLGETHKAEKILQRFGRVDILVTHVPPYGMLDTVNSTTTPPRWNGRHAGSKTILEYIKTFQPRYVLCGHIHEGEGVVNIGCSEVYNLGKAGVRMIDL